MKKKKNSKKKVVIGALLIVILIFGIFVGIKMLQSQRSIEDKIKHPREGEVIKIEGEKEIEKFKKEAEKNGQRVEIKERK